MPKINAPTLAEHRANQRAALLRAGEEILLSAGLSALSPRTVTERAGLTRSSFYDYFATKDDLLVAITIDSMQRWNAEVKEQLQSVEPGIPELRALVDATMRMSADGKHQLAAIVRQASLSPSAVEDLLALHEVLFWPAIRVLTDLGMEPSQTSAMLIQSVLGAGVQLVILGVDQSQVADDVFRLLTKGLTSQA